MPCRIKGKDEKVKGVFRAVCINGQNLNKFFGVFGSKKVVVFIARPHVSRDFSL